MARLQRINPPGIAQHIIQRGNNRQVCFSADEDYTNYLNWLVGYAEKYKLSIHAYVLMTNHVHILATPKEETSIPKTMQSLGRQYVRYFNYSYKRSGTLWEGRYKSSLVEDEHYLLQCYRYIELNPVRAGMVSDPSGYKWSSYRVNALGYGNIGLEFHEQYLRLGNTTAERCKYYKALFINRIDGCALEAIRTATNKGLALGSDRFKDQIEQNLKRRVRPAKLGRPKVNCKVDEYQKSLL